MIVTCASCLTKFYLDDSRIAAKGAKVRCSRCKHVFFISPPPETREEVVEDFESFAKFHEELIEPGQKEKEAEIPTPTKVKREEREGRIAPEEEEEEGFPFFEKGLKEKAREAVPPKPVVEERAEVKAFKPKRMVRGERRGPSLIFSFIVVLVLLVFGIFYLWTELGSEGKLYSYLEYPIQKITEVWDQIWGSEKEGLIVGGLNGYEERIGETPLFIIEGKVNNQSRSTKKHIKIRVEIFDQNRAKLGEKETLCGRTMDREGLKGMPATFFRGAMMVEPKTEKERSAPSGKAIPFMVVFKNLSGQAKEFKVEIVEAPNL